MKAKFQIERNIVWFATWNDNTFYTNVVSYYTGFIDWHSWSHLASKHLVIVWNHSSLKISNFFWISYLSWYKQECPPRHPKHYTWILQMQPSLSGLFLGRNNPRGTQCLSNCQTMFLCWTHWRLEHTDTVDNLKRTGNNTFSESMLYRFPHKQTQVNSAKVVRLARLYFINSYVYI
jgi:hypothetical protein